jgi:hypothetical protein
LKELLKGKPKGAKGVAKKGDPPPKTLTQKLANPEILLFILTVFAMILMGVISNLDITGVNVSKVAFKIEYKDSSIDGEFREYTIVEVAGYAILFLLSFYFIIAAIRLLIRTKRKVVNQGQSAAESIFSKLDKWVQL